MHPLMSRSLLALLLSCTLPAEDTTPVHEELPSSIIAYAVFPSLPTLLAHMQHLVGTFRTLAPGSLLAVSSQILGDPGLTHLDPSRPLVVALLSSASGATPVLAAWIPTMTHDGGGYASGLRSWGLAAKVVGPVTVVASNEEDLGRSTDLLDFYHVVASHALSCDVHLHCACDRAWLAYGDALRDQAWLAASRLAYLPRPAGSPDFVPAMRIGLASIIAVMQDLQDLGVDVSVDEQALHATIDGVAQPGSALAAVLVAPAALPDAGIVLGPGSGITTLVGHIDPHAVSQFVTTFLQRVALQQQLTLNDALVQMLADYGSGTNGSFAVRVSPDAVHGVQLSYVHGVESAASGYAFAQRMVAHFPPAMPVDASTTGMSLPLMVTMQPAASAAAVQVDHLTIAVTRSSLSAEAQTALRAYCRDGEIAFTPAWTLIVQEQNDLDNLIARATAPHLAAGAVTLAESTFPAGYDLYLDSDLVGMVQASVAIINPTASGVPQSLHEALARHQQREPLIVAGRYAQGAMRWQLRMPLAPLAALKAAASEAMAAVAPATPPKTSP
jgi:hypothetical protein